VKTKLGILGGVLILLQGVDGFLTQHLISNGVTHEFNPLMAPVAGEWWFGFGKLTLMLLVVAVSLSWAGDKGHRLGMLTKGFWGMTVFYTFVLGWNLSLLVNHSVL